MRWRLSDRFDPAALELADRHYNRQKPGTNQFVPPGRCLVLLAGGGDAAALWVSSWQFSEFVMHRWPRCWTCTIFRNEGAGLSSELILEAIAATRWHWGEPPADGFITFVDPGKVRKKRDPGRCFLRAGFELVGRSKRRGFITLQLKPENMPAPEQYVGAQMNLFSMTNKDEDHENQGSR